MWALTDAMARNPSPWASGFVLPNHNAGAAYHVLAPDAYVQIKHQIEKTVASSLIYLNSHARDFTVPSCANISTSMSGVPAGFRPWSGSS
jgi:4-hydroxyphenylacetate 3-monooxygenase